MLVVAARLRDIQRRDRSPCVVLNGAMPVLRRYAAVTVLRRHAAVTVQLLPPQLAVEKGSCAAVCVLKNQILEGLKEGDVRKETALFVPK